MHEKCGRRPAEDRASGLGFGDKADPQVSRSGYICQEALRELSRCEAISFLEYLLRRGPGSSGT